MDETTAGQDDRKLRRTPGLGGFASLLVLVAVFYFINAACGAGSGCNCGPEPSLPGEPLPSPDGSTACTHPFHPGSLGFTSPLQASVVSDVAVNGLVSVPVALDVTEITLVAPSGQCLFGLGHIHLLIDTQLMPLHDGLASTVLQLPPGEHTLRATLVDDFELPLPGIASVEVTFNVEAQ
jgi:hypothetical protein